MSPVTLSLEMNLLGVKAGKLAGKLASS